MSTNENILSKDQIRMLLGEMEDKISKTQGSDETTTAQVESNANDQLMQQMTQMMNQMQQMQAQLQNNNSQGIQNNANITNTSTYTYTPPKRNVLEILEEELVNTGCSASIVEIIKKDGTLEQINPIKQQFITYLTRVPELASHDFTLVVTKAAEIIEEVIMGAQVERQKEIELKKQKQREEELRQIKLLEQQREEELRKLRELEKHHEEELRKLRELEQLKQAENNASILSQTQSTTFNQQQAVNPSSISAPQEPVQQEIKATTLQEIEALVISEVKEESKKEQSEDKVQNPQQITETPETEKIKQPEKTSEIKATNVTTAPKIDLKPENNSKPRVVEVKDFFKRFRGNKEEEENENEALSKEVEEALENNEEIIIVKNPEKTEIVEIVTPENANNINSITNETQETIAVDVSSKEKFMKLVAKTIDYVEGAMQRELIRSKADIEKNKRFLTELLQNNKDKQDLDAEIEILEKLLERLDNRMADIKDAKGTMSAWVELDEDIHNVQNMYLVEYKRVFES